MEVTAKIQAIAIPVVRSMFLMMIEATFRDVISPDVTDELTKMLQITEEGTGKAAYIDEGEAGKTGTTDKNVDLWFIGYAPIEDYDYVTGVWLGNDDNSPTNGSSLSGSNPVGKIHEAST